MDMVILENMDMAIFENMDQVILEYIDMDICENIDINKGVLRNISIGTDPDDVLMVLTN